MISDVRLSVALVTRNRPESLRRCLASLRAQEAQPAEIVVSDDSANPADIEITRGLANEFNAIYRTGPRRGLYANRNFAALACTGTHVRTVDDDHTFPAGHFASCLEAARSDPRAIWTVGEIGYIDGKYFDRAETASQLHPAGVGCAIEDLDDNWGIADGSTIYPRDVFELGYRMVEDFSYGMSYLEFGAFLYRRGYRSRCVRGAYVEHHADLATVTRDHPESRLFASLCYNLYFRPSAFRTLRYIGPILCRKPSLIPHVRPLLKLARERWADKGCSRFSNK
jgi:glycosyltransferase involved in cell wall biosynthesis